MKYVLQMAILLAVAGQSLAYSFNWEIGSSQSHPLVLNGTPTTAETFTNAYELLLMDIGDGPAPYSSSRGYATFRRESTGNHRTTPGTIGATAVIPGGAELNGRQFLLVLFEKTTGKHFVLSESVGGEAIAPYERDDLMGDPAFDVGHEYYPTSSTGFFYKGAEIPPFCGWLSKYNLTEDNLAGIPTNRVNLAFAVNANPTDFTGITLAITDVSFSLASFSGAFTFNAKDTAGTPTAITTLRDPAALTIRTTDSLSTGFTPPPASSLSLETNTFEVNTTPTTQFLRLDFTPAKLW